MQPRILVAGFRFPHHSKSSGYHQLASYLPGDYAAADKLPFWDQAFKLSYLRKAYFGLFEAYLAGVTRRYDIIHYLYPENHLIWSIPGNGQCISVVTVHLDLGWMKSDHPAPGRWSGMKKRMFSRVNGLITLSRNQIPDLQRLFPHTQVRFIPHGIVPRLHTGVKCKVPGPEFRIVTVGSNYRDFTVLKELIQYAAVNRQKWKFDVVGAPERIQQEIKGMPNTQVLNNIDERYYQKILDAARIHFLPVTYATANNALLEAHLAGLPSLCSDVNGINDYALPTTYKFGTMRELIHALDFYERMDASNYNQIRERTKQGASRFYWQNIADEVIDFYRELSKTGKNK